MVMHGHCNMGWANVHGHVHKLTCVCTWRCCRKQLARSIVTQLHANVVYYTHRAMATCTCALVIATGIPVCINVCAFSITTYTKNNEDISHVYHAQDLS